MFADCPICSDLFTRQQDGTIMVTTCGHVFHLRCIKRWLSQSNGCGSCPQCRQIVSVTQLKQVHFNFNQESPLISQQSNNQLELDELRKLRKKLEQLEQMKRKYIKGRKQAEGNTNQ